MLPLGFKFLSVAGFEPAFSWASFSHFLPHVPEVDETGWDGQGAEVSLGAGKAEGALQRPSLHESGVGHLPCVWYWGVLGGDEGGRQALDSSARGPRGEGGLRSTDMCQAVTLTIFINSFSFPW